MYRGDSGCTEGRGVFPDEQNDLFFTKMRFAISRIPIKAFESFSRRRLEVLSTFFSQVKVPASLWTRSHLHPSTLLSRQAQMTARSFFTYVQISQDMNHIFLTPKDISPRRDSQAVVVVYECVLMILWKSFTFVCWNLQMNILFMF